jgi:hypothetical protein
MSEETIVASDQTQLPGELLYEYTPKITQVVEYGASADALISGQTPPPVEGARFDIYFEGPITGKLNGTVKAWTTFTYARMAAVSWISAPDYDRGRKEDLGRCRWRGDSGARVASLSAQGERDADRQPPGVLLG